mgnify:CR=1 FL=1
MSRFFFDYALLPQGWTRDVAVEVGADGAFVSVRSVSGAERTQAIAAGEHLSVGMPGIVNAHSHAFQRAMAGLAEYRGNVRDTFWTWREIMYNVAMSITPEDQRDISAHLHIELLKHGYTSLVEFHYLHNQADGSAYDDPAIMSLATLDAARETGMGLTHIPVLYMTADFDGRPLETRQNRFGQSVESLLRIWHALDEVVAGEPDFAIGLSAHSLRAVPPDDLDALLAAFPSRDGCPFHIHIAEQRDEVDASLQHFGKTPVAWLLDRAKVDANWTLVHATHIKVKEYSALAATGATIALCPSTEGNLGDGICPIQGYRDQGGGFAIGSDSHVCVSPWEELRWLEYVQRLHHRERNVMATGAESTGAALLRGVYASAANVTGRPVGRIASGARADLVVLDVSSPQLAGRSPARMVDTMIFAGSANPVRHVMVGGTWRIRDGRHESETRIADRYRRVQERVMKAL